MSEQVVPGETTRHEQYVAHPIAVTEAQVRGGRTLRIRLPHVFVVVPAVSSIRN